jgi:hypothetical protein
MFNTLDPTGDNFTVLMFNDNLAMLENAQFHQIGRGVVSGLDLGIGAGLFVTIADGLLSVNSCVSLTNIPNFSIPDNATSYLWISELGQVVATPNTNPPSAIYVPLGQAIAVAGAVTAVNGINRLLAGRWTDLRTYVMGLNTLVVDLLNARVGVGKTPLKSFDVAGAANIDGALTSKVPLSVKTAAYAITVAESGTQFTNEGAGALVALTLPAAAAGLRFAFYVQDVDGIEVIAQAGDTIRIAATVSSAGGNAQSTTQGDFIELVAINATEWIARSVVGAGWGLA